MVFTIDVVETLSIFNYNIVITTTSVSSHVLDD